MIKIAPSLLSADFAKLADEIRDVEDGGADLLHVDVMDGHFVPNITLGPFVVEAIKRIATIPLDVHLMIDEPRTYARQFVDAGADNLFFHIEAEEEPRSLVDDLHKLGVRAGIALSPQTKTASIEPYLGCLDVLLVMTVNPGFGGQEFMPDMLDKVNLLRRDAGNSIDIEVDGGIDVETTSRVISAGANVLVAGTAVFGAADRREAIRLLRSAAEESYSETP